MTEQQDGTTFGAESSLPRMPLPALIDSAERFLRWCAPLLTDDEFAETERAVAQFLAPDSPAHALQDALSDYDDSGVDSWLDQFWRDRYLGRRSRIALNANFFFLFDDTGETQADRAAGLIAGALAYKRSIDDETLPAVTMRGEPVSMGQNRYLFSTTRIPDDPLDSARHPYSEQSPGPSRERHVLVFSRGAMYRLDVLGPDGTPYALDELATSLRAIAATEPSRADEVGHLTTKARAEWAESRAALLACDAANVDALDVVERALFCVCLESEDAGDTLTTCNRLLYGSAANRWYDKAVSFIVFPDGTAGLNGEHCLLDGTTVIGLIDAILSADSAEHARRAGAASQGAPPFGAVEFVLDERLREDIRTAGADFAAYGDATASTTVALDDFGAEVAKELKASPDGFVQAAYQLAHQRSRGRLGATYESIATRQFLGGRTEAMRVVTPQSAEFVAAMENPDASADTRRAAARAAIDAHAERARECQQGAAPEQHLWELQLLQGRRGPDVAMPLYDSPGWQIMRADYLSTSSVPSTHVPFWGFGSTSPTCIGVAYALLPDRFHLYLSAPDSLGAELQRFATELPRAIGELRELLT